MTDINYEPQEDLLTPEGQKWIAAVETLIGSAYAGTEGRSISTINCSRVEKDGVDIGAWKITIEPLSIATDPNDQLLGVIILPVPTPRSYVDDRS